MGLFDGFRRVRKGFLLFNEALKTNGSDVLSQRWGQPFDFKAYCEKWNGYYLSKPKVKSAVVSTAGQVMAEGIYLQPATRLVPETGKREKYERANEARALCEKLNERINLDALGFETALRMVKYGTCFWEKTFTPEFSVQLVYAQSLMKPRVDRDKNWTGWVLQDSLASAPRASWSKDEVVAFAWDVDANYPYGTSLLTGIDDDMETYRVITDALKRYAKRQAFATDVLQIGDQYDTPGADEMSAFSSALKTRSIGDTVITSHPISKQTLGGGAMETRVVPEMLKHVDDQLTDALMTPPISKLYSSTEASSTEMTDWVRAILITPLQRIIKTKLEKEVYWPFLEAKGFSVNTIPRVLFNTPEAGRGSEADYWQKLVQSMIASPRQAAEELGFEYDEEFFKAKERADAAKAEADAKKTIQAAQGRQAPNSQPETKVPAEKTGPKPEVNTRSVET